MSVKFVSAILGPEMGAPILWTPGKMHSFCRKNHVRKIPVFGGGFWGGGGGSADFIFMGARIFLKKINANFFVQSFLATLRVMDVRAENRGRPHQKVRFPAAPVVGRNFLTPGHPGVRVRNVRGKSGPKSLCLCCFFFPEINSRKPAKVAKVFKGEPENGGGFHARGSI